ncbi:MAG: hypothetical protein GC155_03105 [Alphaproteobacteria bacterium]|nr:hypothetical protein [Alphaproteobacteria bacterium]
MAFNLFPTQRSLQMKRDTLGMTDKQIADAVAALLAQGRIERAPLQSTGKGGKRDYLRPIDSSAATPPAKSPNADGLFRQPD